MGSTLPQSTLPPRRQGFTLIELLVVLGIITLLVGLLAPTVAGVRRDSRKTVCKAQLQQIGYALRMYLNHSRERYPRAPALPSVNPNGYATLMDQLSPNLGNDLRIFRCPSDLNVYPAEQTSYFYYNEAGERPIQQTFLWKVYRGDVTRIPILWDADNFHGGGVPFNWLFLDGHVDQFLKPDTGGGTGN
jgi:prepilin-type N-terminal cleavage/methylation domain-containing protein/prepilin-type processing-associated H-X9-DG protein